MIFSLGILFLQQYEKGLFRPNFIFGGRFSFGNFVILFLHQNYLGFTTPPVTDKTAPRSRAKQESFKKKLKNSRDNSDNCEICNAYFPDVLEAAHIVDEALRNVLLAAYKKDKTLPVSVNDCPNGLLLCPTCHSFFDKRPTPLIRISSDGTILLFGTALQSSIKHLHKTKVNWHEKLGNDKDFPTPALLNLAMNLKPGAKKRLRELEDESDEEFQDDEKPVKGKRKFTVKKAVVKKPKAAAKKAVVNKPKAAAEKAVVKKPKAGSKKAAGI